ncbi:MAG: RNA polymerase sigma-70 factor (ECF subfamily) [Vicingaceae bacterium]
MRTRLQRTSTTNKFTDEQLIALANKGDEVAFGLIYDRYSTLMLNFFYAKLQSKEKAEDFLQNLFVKLIEKGDSFNETKTFRTWFYTLAHNQCKNEYRSLSRSKIEYNNIEDNRLVNNWEEGSEKMDSSIFSEHLTFELNKLGNDQQSSFLLRFKYSFSIKEISEVLECSEGTTKSRLFYTLKKLANELKEFNPY